MNEAMILLFSTDASSIFQWVVENASYLLVFVLMVVESSFIPFPSEVVVPPAAYLSAQSLRQMSYNGGTINVSDMNVIIIVLVATAGAIVGALINYYLSVWIGRPLVYKFADSRLGHACLINREKVDKAEQYFDKHGSVSTFVGRLIPAVRQLISIPAGLAKMNIGKFILYTGLGAGVWNAILAGLGYWLGKTVQLDELFTKVEEYNDYLTYAGLGIGAVCVGIILYNALKNKNN